MKRLRLCRPLVALILSVGLLTACTSQTAPGAPSNQPTLRVHFIDVGQADAILVQSPEGETLLIDGGNGADGELVANYLKEQGIKKLSAIVATHPHEDHIGGLPAVLQAIGAKVLYMPDATSTTKTFERFLDAAQSRADKVVQAKTDLKMTIGSATATFLSPDAGQHFDELNDYSAVLQLKFGSTTMLFTGDAEKPVEQILMKRAVNLKSDLLKVGHHGGSTSSSEEFLKAVAPNLAVLMVGKDNDYGHPHRETMQRLEKTSARILRTDRDGTIVVNSDGKTLTVEHPQR